MQNKWNRWVEAFAEVAANQIQLSQSQSQSLQKPLNLFEDATKFNQVLPLSFSFRIPTQFPLIQLYKTINTSECEISFHDLLIVGGRLESQSPWPIFEQIGALSKTSLIQMISSQFCRRTRAQDLVYICVQEGKYLTYTPSKHRNS